MISFKRESGKVCPPEDELVAYLQDELDAVSKKRVEDHRASCPACGEELVRYEKLIWHMKTAWPDTAGRDLAPQILARVEQLKAPPSLSVLAGGRSFSMLRIAAVFVGALTVGFMLVCLMDEPNVKQTVQREAVKIDAVVQESDHVISMALRWLCKAQDADGHWDVERWGAQRNYSVGINALALLAFLRQGTDRWDPNYRSVVERGVGHLIRQMNDEGRFGPLCSGTPYNQGIGTLALLEACRLIPCKTWQEAADRALVYIEKTQRASGGWGYPRSPGDQGNTSITVWQLQALIKAEQSGRDGARARVEKGLAWLSKNMDEGGRIGYKRAGDFPYGHLTLTAAGALCLLSDPNRSVDSERLAKILNVLRTGVGEETTVDYYRYYFLAGVFRADKSMDSEKAVAELCRALSGLQQGQGEHAGSYDPVDRWSSAGGRIYATAMAVLAL